MTNENLMNIPPNELQIQQIATKFNKAQSILNKLYLQADGIQAEIRALGSYLSDPPDNATVAELKIIEMRKDTLETRLAVKCRELEPAYRQVKDLGSKLEELQSQAKDAPLSHRV